MDKRATVTPARRSKKNRIASSTIAIYSSIFVLLVAVVSIGYRAPQEIIGTNTNRFSLMPAQVQADDGTPVNAVVATSIAASVARITEIPVAPYIAERAISTKVESQYASTTDLSSITKPTIVQLSSASRNIAKYTVKSGDTVQSVAALFGVTPDTIKWANNLTSDNLIAGTSLDILPRSGVTYIVKDGDTIQKIAEKYGADASLVITYNDLEISGLKTGLKIILPGGQLPVSERPGYASLASAFSTGFVTGYGAWSGEVLKMGIFRGVDANSGGYAPGNCTAYAFYRRAQMGMPVPSNLGNAYTWATQARAYNYLVDKNPSVGAVIQSGNHVGVIEEVYPNGDLRITDMNYGYRLYNLAERIIPAATVSSYLFIH